MKKKVIFFDVDGTLKHPERKISDRVENAIKNLKKNGHYVFVCTGRNKVGVESLRYMNFDGYICSAGGYIEVHNQKIYESFMVQEDVEELIHVFEKKGIGYNLEANDWTFQDDKMYLEMTSEHDENQMNSELRRMLHEFAIRPFQEYINNPLPIQKLCFLAKEESQLKDVQNQYSDKYHFVIHDIFSKDSINGEVIPKNKNKGLAVQQVCDYLGVSLEETIGFGDSMNDYEMIKTCHYGVAMGNASQKLKDESQAVCETLEQDGVYHELKRLKLI